MSTANNFKALVNLSYTTLRLKYRSLEGTATLMKGRFHLNFDTSSIKIG